MGSLLKSWWCRRRQHRCLPLWDADRQALLTNDPVSGQLPAMTLAIVRLRARLLLSRKVSAKSGKRSGKIAEL